MTPPLGIVAYLALFVAVGVLFLLVNLLVGYLIRPRRPSPLKGEIYECGEPSIGSGFVQFDLRFYVVALIFIIFDVEVAFFFPWATFFGKATQLAATQPGNQVVQSDGSDIALTSNARMLYREMGIANPTVPRDVPASLATSVASTSDAVEQSTAIVKLGARQLAWLTLFDIGIFFAVLVVGFAYVWYRRDLDWVRSLSDQWSQARDLAVAATDRGIGLERVLSGK